MFKLIFIFVTMCFVGCGKSPFLKEPLATGAIKAESIETNVRIFDSEKKIEVKWLTKKNSFDEAQALVFLYSNDKLYDPEESEDISFYLWMESMGHGSSPIFVKRLDKGIYSLSEIYFSMPGDWQLKIDFKKNNKTIVFDYFLNE